MTGEEKRIRRFAGREGVKKEREREMRGNAKREISVKRIVR